MEELLKRLKQIGLNEDQAKKAITIMGEFIGEKYPMLKGQITNLLGAHGKNEAPQVGGINLEGLG